jgi:hypothetical protein
MRQPTNHSRSITLHSKANNCTHIRLSWTWFGHHLDSALKRTSTPLVMLLSHTVLLRIASAKQQPSGCALWHGSVFERLHSPVCSETTSAAQQQCHISTTSVVASCWMQCVLWHDQVTTAQATEHWAYLLLNVLHVL